jgi:hypothetical protein
VFFFVVWSDHTQGGRIEPVAIAAMATSIGASGKAAPSTTTWNYYTSFTNELPFDAFAIPAACFASSPLPPAAGRLRALPSSFLLARPSFV